MAKKKFTGKSIYDTPIKSKRRAGRISITSPTTFRESIRELRKDRYTLSDYRALILAQNRARGMLNKKDLSTKEKKQMQAISEIKIPKPK